MRPHTLELAAAIARQAFTALTALAASLSPAAAAFTSRSPRDSGHAHPSLVCARWMHIYSDSERPRVQEPHAGRGTPAVGCAN